MAIPLVSDTFPRFSEADWAALVARSTRGRTSGDLASRSDDGIPVGPLYGRDADGRVLPRRSPGRWTIAQRIDIPDIGAARDQMGADLAGGASGLELVFAGSVGSRGAGIASIGDQALTDLLGGLTLDGITLRVDAGEATPGMVTRLLRLVEGRGVADVVSSFDPIATLAARGSLQQPFEATGRAIADAFEAMESVGLPGIAVVADGRPWHDGGASEAQELAAVLSAFVAYLRLFEAHGIGPEHAMERIGVVLSADAGQVLTIAKFRAMRLLHARLTESMGLAPHPCTIHGETSWRMMSRRDAHMNLLRTTSAAFAAGVGGADSVTALPFTAARGLADPFARRLARNSQTILIEEAGFGRVADPAAGSGALEGLTAALAEKAWERFRSIESEGGLLAAVQEGTVQRDVAAMRDARLDRVRSREIELIGTTAFVHLDAVEAKAVPAPRRKDAAIETGGDRLVAVRLAEPFEALRDRADDLAAKGARPAVFLAGLGGDFSAAADLATGFLASGGVIAVGNQAFPTPEATAEAFARSGTPFACICLSRDDTDVASLAMALRTAGARRVYAAAQTQPGPTIAGIDAVIAKGTDAVALIGDLLDSADAGLAEKQ